MIWNRVTDDGQQCLQRIVSKLVVRVRQLAHVSQVTHALEHHSKVIVSQIIRVKVEVRCDVSELCEGNVKCLAQTVVQLVALQDHFLVVDSQ